MPIGSFFVEIGHSVHENIQGTHTIVAMRKDDITQQLVELMRNEGARKRIIIFTWSNALRHAAGTK